MLESTILRSTTGNFLGKHVVVENGEVTDSFSPGSEFQYHRVTFDTARGLGMRLAGFSMKQPLLTPDCMLTHSVPRDPNTKTGPRQEHLFKRTPTSIAVFDLEKAGWAPGLSWQAIIDDPDNAIRDQLAYIGVPADIGWTFVLSSKAGFTPDFRGHLYLQLDKPYEPEAIDDWIKGMESPITDLSIYADGHAIISVAPLVTGAIDPFKKRVFWDNGQGLGLVPNVPDYSGYVRGTVMKKRRAKGHLPELSDIVLEGHHITDAVVKDYLPRLRAALGDVPWDEARPYLESELQRLQAPPSVYARLKGDVNGKWKGKYLGLPWHRWEHLRGSTDHDGALMRPRYVEPKGDVVTEQTRLKNAVKDVIGTGGAHLFRASLGMGKTEAAVVAAVTEGMTGSPAIIAVPSHERADELCSRLNAELERQVDEYTEEWGQFALTAEEMRRWEAWRGREQEGMCQRVPVVKAAQRAGVSVHDDVCGFGKQKRCPHFQTCPYAQQVEGFFRYNWVVPHAMLEHSSRLSKDAETIMADESFVQNLIGHVRVDLSELKTRDRDLSDIYDALLARTKNPEVNEIVPIDKDRLEEALAVELEARTVPEIDTEWTDDDIVAVCDEATETYRSKVVSLLRALIAEHDGGRNHVYCWKGSKGPRALVAYRKRPKFISEKHTVIMFDATPNEKAIRKFFPDVVVDEFVAPNQNLVVVQVGDRTGQVNEFLPRNNKEAEVERAARNRARLADWAHAQPGKGILLVKKAVEEAMAEEHDMKMPMGHFHALEGQDVWQFEDGPVKGADLDWCAIVQRSCPPAHVPEEEAMGYFCDDEEQIQRQPWNGGLPWYKTVNVELADGIGGVRYVHPDERVDGCLRHILQASQLQALGRMRGTRREKVGVVYVLHNIALEVEVTAVVRSAMLNAMVGGVALYGAAEIERVFGYSGRFIEKVDKPAANVRYWTEGSSNRGCKAWAVDGVDVGAVMRAIGAVRWERF